MGHTRTFYPQHVFLFIVRFGVWKAEVFESLDIYIQYLSSLATPLQYWAQCVGPMLLRGRTEKGHEVHAYDMRRSGKIVKKQTSTCPINQTCNSKTRLDGEMSERIMVLRVRS